MTYDTGLFLSNFGVFCSVTNTFWIFAALAVALPQTKPQKVGAEKCTWGPSYWCASRENAQSCGVSIIWHFKAIFKKKLLLK